MCAVVALSLIFAASSDQPGVECGAYCTYACLRALDISVPSYQEFQQRLGPATNTGYSMAQLSDVARAYGAHTLGVATNLENLQRRSGRLACIVRLPPAHFVVLSDVADDMVALVDPPRDYTIPLAPFGRTGTGRPCSFPTSRWCRKSWWRNARGPCCYGCRSWF